MKIHGCYSWKIFSTRAKRLTMWLTCDGKNRSLVRYSLRRVRRSQRQRGCVDVGRSLDADIRRGDVDNKCSPTPVTK
eukprot:138375-Prorocentrum_minimum.AAC.3